MVSSRSTGDSQEECVAIDPDSQMACDIQEKVLGGIDTGPAGGESPSRDPVWERLHEQGTSLWLDTGDMEAIAGLWDEQLAGVTTNNALLNDQVQRGEYDNFIAEASKMLHDLPRQQRVREIALMLNARHGVRLARRFGCLISVELHTDIADDYAATINHARRLHAMCPDHFLIKIPLTATGVIATREVRKEKIRVNMTLGFSARQNYLATALANPSFVNVFLGRLTAYVADNQLGDGSWVGEKATLASQHEVNVFARGLPQSETQQIGASIRDTAQVEAIAGVNVITMPPKVAEQIRQDPDRSWRSRLNDDYRVELASSASAEQAEIEKLWTISNELMKLVEQMILSAPRSAEELTQAAADHQLSDLFPQLSREELDTLAADGKIPQHTRWKDRIAQGQAAIDSLLTLAGLAYFAQSQKRLDQRIQEQMDG